MSNIGPVVMKVAGDTFIAPARISAIVWEGVTNAGDIAEIKCPVTLSLLWAGRTDSTQTYIGLSIPTEGIHAPNGFKLTQFATGRVLVYLRDN